MDDPLISAATHGLGVLGGGAGASWIAKLVFGSITKRLDKLEETIEKNEKAAVDRDRAAAERHEKLVEKLDKRHEELIERLAKVESKAEAAHRRLDELPVGRKRR